MALRLYNTLTGTIEVFKPITADTVGMYTCGPTVYDFAHIGNLRTYMLADVLRRTLEYTGYRVQQIMNLTDIGHLESGADEGEDKMVTALRRLNKPETLEGLREVGTVYADAFTEDLQRLNIEMPAELPRASEHVADQIALIEILEQKGFAYRISTGVYFDIGKFPSYGTFGGRGGNEAGARIAVNSEKRDPRDFVLWKLSDVLGWESPWGKGFPGWHIECSAMSVKYLNQPFDIHMGGEDLKFPHHENEIAQSQAAADVPLARYFIHSAFLTIAGNKMAKSAGTFVTLRDIEKKDISPRALRYLYLTTHYRSPLHFSFEALLGAQTALDRLQHAIADSATVGKISTRYRTDFLNALLNDLNTPQALAVVWNTVKDDSLSSVDKRATLLDMDRVLGLNLERAKSDTVPLEEIPAEVRERMASREKAREAKDWNAADRIRDEIRTLGYDVQDSDEGQIILKKERAAD